MSGRALGDDPNQRATGSGAPERGRALPCLEWLLIRAAFVLGTFVYSYVLFAGWIEW